MTLLIHSIAAAVIACPMANAAVVIATENQFAGADVPEFTPTYVINPINNVLAGLLPTASAPSEAAFTTERSGGLSVLTDGQFGSVNNDGSSVATHPALATFGPGAGTSLTYSFAATSLTGVIIYGGWNDQGRDEQSYTVQYSTDNGTTFFDLGTVQYNPGGTVGQSANRVSFTDDTGALAGGASITNLRINANATENGYAGLAEITAYAVPEPSTAFLGLIGALGLLRRRRA